MSEQKIIQGDCLEVMKTFPDKSFDLILTDPPYGINVGGKLRERERELKSAGRSRLVKVGIKGASLPKATGDSMTLESPKKKCSKK
jgi:DNA modification methylase